MLQNHKHHEPSRNLVDECSSGPWFAHWAAPLARPPPVSPVAEPVTWLARLGSKRHGPIRFEEGPVD